MKPIIKIGFTGKVTSECLNLKEVRELGTQIPGNKSFLGSEDRVGGRTLRWEDAWDL